MDELTRQKFHRSIDDIVEDLNVAKEQGGQNCCLLIGAGCSVSAGIPHAAGLVEIIRTNHPQAYARAKAKGYPQCMAELSPSQRRLLISQQVNQAKINWAHVCIALLMKHKFIDRVLTTNFDPLVVRACALLGVFPAVYDFAASQNLMPSAVPDESVFYLHGQSTGFVLMNTEAETKNHSKRLEPLFQDAGEGRMWIVVGYSGENDPVFDQLAKVGRFEDSLYWIGYLDNPPSVHVQNQLLKEGKYAFFTTGFDADSFFIEVTKRLGIFPPDLIQRPFTHLDEVMATLAPFPEGVLATLSSSPEGDEHPPRDSEIQNSDVAGQARQLVQQAISQFEGRNDDGIGNDQDQRSKENSQILEANALLMKGDYDAVIALKSDYDENRSVEFNSSLLRAYQLKSTKLVEQARAVTGPESDALFEDAEQQIELAVAMAPNNARIFNSWGALLGFQAEMKSGEAALEVFESSANKFQQAMDLDPHNLTGIVNAGSAWFQRAIIATNQDSAQDLDRAIAYYEQALEIDPEAMGPKHLLGQSLIRKSRIQSGGDSDLLANRAKNYLIQVEETEPGHAAYDIARVSARLGQLRETRHWLVLCKNRGNLPSARTVNSNPDFQVVKDKPWFIKLIGSR